MLNLVLGVLSGYDPSLAFFAWRNVRPQRHEKFKWRVHEERVNVYNVDTTVEKRHAKINLISE